MNRLFPVILFFIILSCNNNENDDPYADIYAQPAFAAITDSIRRTPGNDELYFRRAVLLNTNNFPEPALADFRKAWSLKKNEQYAVGIANLLLDKKPDSALQFLDKALNDLPGSLLLQLTQARAYDAHGDLDAALRICDHILGNIPNELDVLKLKSDLLARKGNISEAILILEKVYSLVPYDVELNYELASRYAETKNPKVIALCDSLLKQDTDSTNMHAEPAYFKGLYYANINEKEKALAQFEQAIQRNYYYLNAYIEKGRILLDQKNIAGALKTFNLALTISPKFPDAYFWIAKCQEAEGKKEEARLNYQRAFSLDPGFTEAKEAADKLK